MSSIFYRLFRIRYDKLRNLRQFIWNSQGRVSRKRNTYLMEQMENRYLLSADAAPLALSAELLNEELIIEQLIDAGLAEASNTQDLQLVRQHDYEPVASNENETPQADSTQKLSKQALLDTEKETDVSPETNSEETDLTAEAAATIQYIYP